MNMRDIASGLRFPEGPVACRDGSVIVVEIAAGRVTRIGNDGNKNVIAETGGGPNGAAFGPDGRLYVCNNGGMRFFERDGLLLPGPARDDDRTTGWIDAIDPATGAVETIYTHCDGEPLKAPNDLVFDTSGGFWFTDHGKMRRRTRDVGAVYYATADGASINQVLGHMDSPNGIGLSPGGDRLYVAETHPGRVWEFTIGAPGTIAPVPGPAPWLRGNLLANPNGYCLLDSLAVDAAGRICVASIPHALQCVAPDGSSTQRIDMPDLMPTNICFGTAGHKQAFVTLSAAGRLVAIDWPGGGTQLAFDDAS